MEPACPCLRRGADPRRAEAPLGAVLEHARAAIARDPELAMARERRGIASPSLVRRLCRSPEKQSLAAPAGSRVASGIVFIIEMIACSRLSRRSVEVRPAPSGAAERQALLEAEDLSARTDTLIAITEMALADDDKDGGPRTLQ